MPRAIRFGVVLLGALVLLLLRPAPAYALFGVGGLVYDPANHKNAVLRYAQLILQARQLHEQVRVATGQAEHAYRQARGFSPGRLRLPSVGGLLERIEGRFGSGDAVGYGNSDLDRLFLATFPEAADWNRRVAGRQAEALRSLAREALLAARDQHLHLDGSRARRDELKASAAEASTDREVAQVANRLAAEQLDEQALTRTALLGATNLQAAALAQDAGRAAREAMADTATALWTERREAVRAAAEHRVEARARAIRTDRARRTRGAEPDPS